MASPILHRIDCFHARNPMLCAIWWAGIKGCAASCLADVLKAKIDQTRQEERTSQKILTRRPNIDYNKALAFGLWSGFYCGGILKKLYTDLFPRAFPLVDVKTGLRHPLFRRHVLAMVIVDNFISTPFFFNPSYYGIKSVLEGLSSPELETVRNPAYVLRRAADRYKSEWLAVNKVTWGFWIPLHLLTFSVVPPHWRVPFTAWCSLFTLAGQSVNQTVLEEHRRLRERSPSNGALLQ